MAITVGPQVGAWQTPGPRGRNQHGSGMWVSTATGRHGGLPWSHRTTFSPGSRHPGVISLPAPPLQGGWGGHGENGVMGHRSETSGT